MLWLFKNYFSTKVMLIHLTLLLVHTTVVFFETFYAIVITSCKSASMLTLNVISCGRYYWKMHSLLLINSLTPISEWLLKVSLSSLGNVKRKVQRIQILMLGMGGCHRQQYRHNKSFVMNRNGLLVFWRTVYLISRDLFKIQMDKSPMVKWNIQAKNG